MIGIIGGGFGLYGYLPAVCDYYKEEIILIELRHKTKFINRQELSKYTHRIKWINNIFDLINQSVFLILAIPPSEVNQYLNHILVSPSIKYLLIDKPICHTPDISENFIKNIESKNIKIISSYLFFYTKWFQKLKDQINISNSIKIEWDILNKNSDNSWKKNILLGGGPLKFYGIHLLSLITYFEYSIKNIISYNNEYFEALFTTNSNSTILIKINSNSSNPGFKINNYTTNIVDQETPFELYKDNINDFRIIPLKNLFYNLETNYNELNLLMKKTNDLWKQIELKLN